MSFVLCGPVIDESYLVSAYTQRWFLLAGNLLFYCRAEHPVRVTWCSVSSWQWLLIVHMQDSVVVGLIILERCRVVVEGKDGNRNAFRLSECIDGGGWKYVYP